MSREKSEKERNGKRWWGSDAAIETLLADSDDVLAVPFKDFRTRNHERIGISVGCVVSSATDRSVVTVL